MSHPVKAVNVFEDFGSSVIRVESRNGRDCILEIDGGSTDNCFCEHPLSAQQLRDIASVLNRAADEMDRAANSELKANNNNPVSAELKFRTEDHPEANGRTPQAGDSAYTLWFPIENGDRLTVEMGSRGMADLRNIILSQQIDEDFVKIEGTDPQ